MLSRQDSRANTCVDDGVLMFRHSGFANALATIGRDWGTNAIIGPLPNDDKASDLRVGSLSISDEREVGADPSGCRGFRPQGEKDLSKFEEFAPLWSLLESWI